MSDTQLLAALRAKSDTQSQRVVSAVETTLDHFGIQTNRDVMGHGLLKMAEVGDENIDGSDDRVQVLIQMYRYFKSLLTVCAGCGRPESHKMCPAWGTPLYMSGELLTPELQAKYAPDRQRALEKARANATSYFE